MSFQSVHYQTHLFRNRWEAIVAHINKKPGVLEEIRKEVVDEEVAYADEDDPNEFGECPTDSDPEE